ncbi:MAG: hypothetical protein ABMA02_04435 [Saprospiraceae bacterium]
MKQLVLVLFLLVIVSSAQAQFFGQPDTVFIQTFTVDPSDTMLPAPNGNDMHWVNWDADNLPTYCGDEQPVPRNWFWDSDLGDPNDPPVNFAFTSCSFLKDGLPNQNWLITPPVFVADSTVMLSWRSSSFEGPGYLDGYKILVSTASNEPFLGVFTDTLFVAAEMTEALVPGSLLVEDYLFSPGYIHADSYTQPDYFFLLDPSAQAYTGRLEPHTANLARYVGQYIYIAFLHDSQDDNILQIDDIAIVRGESTSAAEPGVLNLGLRVLPNPVSDHATVSWQAVRAARSGLLTISDVLGKLVLEQAVPDLSVGFAKLHLGRLAAGTYACSLATAGGQQTVMVVKR